MGIHCCNFGLPRSVIQMFRSSCCLFSLFWQAEVAVMCGASAIGDGTLFAQHAWRESQTVEMFQD